ncbi:ThiF family adenylyltransferase [Pseudoneobacillus sp. C159]
MEGLQRYSRQILFQPIGKVGQQKLMQSRVVIVGMGALGTVIANHLVRAGIGTIRFIDRDFVELSNLQRQSLFTEEDALQQLPKVIAAENILRKMNSTVILDPILADLNMNNAEELLQSYDVIIDGTDNFLTRYLINDVAIKHDIPWVMGGAVSSRGMFATIIPGKTPCYRCLFPDIPAGYGENCDTVGVLSAITDIIGSFEAVEAIKLLVGAPTNPNLEQLDIWDHSSLQMDVSQGRNSNCPACGHHQFDFLESAMSHQATYTTLCGRDTVQMVPRNLQPFDFTKIAEGLAGIGQVKQNAYLLRFQPNEEITMVLFKDGRVLIHGTDDVIKAKSFYAKYIGT